MTSSRPSSTTTSNPRTQDYLLSVVIPVFNEELVVSECISRVQAVMRSIGCRYEVIFVDDGSKDDTVNILREKRESDKNLKVISFSRNFGHQLAITAGLDHSRGDCVVTMDGDLQDPPEVIVEMVKKWQEGSDVVYARRRTRAGETPFKKYTASMYYRLLNAVTRIDIPVDTGDFRLMSRVAVDALGQIRETHRYLRGIVAWLGFKQGFVEYDRDKRLAGSSNFTLAQSVRLSIYGITSFSALPLRVATIFGAIIFLVGLLLALRLLYLGCCTALQPEGWLVTIDVVLLLSGIQLLCLGFVSEYLSILSADVKHRPLYIISQIDE